MAKTTNADIKEFAEALFMQGTPQNIIAEKVGVSANTVSRWAKDYHWGEKCYGIEKPSKTGLCQ